VMIYQNILFSSISWQETRIKSELEKHLQETCQNISLESLPQSQVIQQQDFVIEKIIGQYQGQTFLWHVQIQGKTPQGKLIARVDKVIYYAP